MNIFIVEDSPIVQGILAKELSHIDGVVICGTAQEPVDAIQSIRENKPDLVILDVILKKGNGFEVLKKIRNEGSDVRVMILTNHSYQHYRSISREMGADLFFDKSIELEKAIQAIRDMACNTRIN